MSLDALLLAADLAAHLEALEAVCEEHREAVILWWLDRGILVALRRGMRPPPTPPPPTPPGSDDEDDMFVDVVLD